jgi:hypothetical protein
VFIFNPILSKIESARSIASSAGAYLPIEKKKQAPPLGSQNLNIKWADQNGKIF